QALEALPEHEQASRLLASFEGLDRYLAGVGEDVARLAPPARVRAAIGSLLGEVFADQSDFELHPERVSAALERLNSTALVSNAELTVVARLEGMTISSEELPLAPGLTIARPQALDGLPPEAQSGKEDAPGHLVIALASKEPDARLAVEQARALLRDL